MDDYTIYSEKAKIMEEDKTGFCCCCIKGRVRRDAWDQM
jgi:hypothetical protein